MALPFDDPVFVLSIAMAINGPYDMTSATSKYSLDDLRNIRWAILPSDQQSMLMYQAKAVIAQMASVTKNVDGSYTAIGLT